MRTIEAMQRQLLGLIGRAVVNRMFSRTIGQAADVILISGEAKAGGVLVEP